METQPKADLSNYIFADESSWIFSGFINFITNLMGMAEMIIPLVERGFIRRFRVLGKLIKGEYSISIAAKMLAIKNDFRVNMINWHDKRLMGFNFMISIAYIPIAFIGAVLLALVPEKYLNAASLRVFFQIYIFLLAILSIRIGSLMIRKHYADTISAMNGIYLMLELFHPDGISTPNHRKRIQRRLNFLANSIVLLAQRYRSASGENERLISEHFQSIEEYIRERERWVVLPKETTLEELRKDFAALLPILINGNYGDFIVPVKEQKIKQEPPYWRKVAGGILGFIGLVIPIFSLMNLYVIKTQDFLPANTDPNTFTAIMAAWLLLTLDGILKLGLIETFTNLVKSVRELR